MINDVSKKAVTRKTFSEIYRPLSCHMSSRKKTGCSQVQLCLVYLNSKCGDMLHGVIVSLYLVEGISCYKIKFWAHCSITSQVVEEHKQHQQVKLQVLARGLPEFEN